MTDDIQRMDIKEFREFGLLQEVNRLFFHPRGLALEVVIDEETGEETLGGVWDYREDPEGVYFTDGANESKALAVAALGADKEEARKAALGYVIQPAED